VPAPPGGSRPGSRTGLYAGIAAGVVALLVAVAVAVSTASGGDPQVPSAGEGPTPSPATGVLAPTGPAVPTEPAEPAAETQRPEPAVDPSLAAVVRHAGTATLRSENFIDLDSRADNWDQNSSAGAASPDLQLYYGGSAISAYSDASFVPVAPGSPVTYQTCAAATGYTDKIDAASIEDKISFCALTDGNRYSYIKITSAAPAESGGFTSVVLNITTFELRARPTPTSSGY
jgi:hypothetical protein